MSSDTFIIDVCLVFCSLNNNILYVWLHVQLSAGQAYNYANTIIIGLAI